MFGVIYKATNLKNGKVYIGLTTVPLRDRVSVHLWYAKNGSTAPFHKALRKYGLKGFNWEILAKARTDTSLRRKEQLYIQRYNAYGKDGYNATLGGDGVLGHSHPQRAGNHWKVGYHCTPEQRNNISEGLKKGWITRRKNKGPLTRTNQAKAWETRRERLQLGILVKHPSSKKGTRLSLKQRQKVSDGLRRAWQRGDFAQRGQSCAA